MTSDSTSAADPPDIYCPLCGYDLRGIDTSGRCPECGWQIDTNAVARSQIPWIHRREIGRGRAFWRTVWVATWQVKRLASESVRPVDEFDARRFATRTALVAAVPLALTLLATSALYGGTRFLNPLSSERFSFTQIIPPAADLAVPYAAGITLWPVAPLGIVLAAWLMTRAGAIWFRGGGDDDDVPAERKRRVATLSLYATAPLAFVPLALLFILAAAAIEAADLSRPLFILFWALVAAGWFIVAFGLFLSWLNTLCLLHRTMQPSALRLIAVAVALPLSWVVCAAIALGAVPWVIGFLWVMIDSLLGS